MRINLVTLFAVLLGSATLAAQHKQLLYDFYEIPQSLMINPGVKTPYKWHAGAPLLSGIGFQAGANGISVNDLFANDGIDFTTKVRDRAINGLSPRDEFGGSGQIEIFSGGFRSANRPNDYYSFGMYGEGFASVFWPRDLAILAFEGNANNLNRRFDLGHLKVQGEAVNVFHFGVNRKLNDKWNVGLRGKIYSSVFEFKSTRNSGYFITTEGTNNILANTLVADLKLQTSGVSRFLEIIDDSNGISAQEELPKWLLGRSFFGGNLGIGADFGFTYQLNQNTILTGSLLDVGFIYHTNGLENYSLNGAVTNEGVEIFLPEDLFQGNTDLWQELVDDIEALVPYDINEEPFLSVRPIKLNASIRYNFGEAGLKTEDCYCDYQSVATTDRFDYLNAVGGHLSMINRARGPQAALTAFYQRRFGSILALKGTYTVDKYSMTNLGLGLNLQAGPVNFYVLADNLLGYQNLADSHYASFQFGFNIISWNDN